MNPSFSNSKTNFFLGHPVKGGTDPSHFFKKYFQTDPSQNWNDPKSQWSPQPRFDTTPAQDPTQVTYLCFEY